MVSYKNNMPLGGKRIQNCLLEMSSTRSCRLSGKQVNLGCFIAVCHHCLPLNGPFPEQEVNSILKST